MAILNFNFKAFKILALISAHLFARWWKWIIIPFLFILLLGLMQAKFNFFPGSNVLRIGMVGTYQEHDMPVEVTSFLSVGFMELVSSREVNNDGTIFKFKIKENLKWSDNTPLTANDFEFNIPDAEMSIPDEYTISFKLKDSYSPFPSLLTKPVFKKSTKIGIGPYRISKIEKSRIFITKIILEPLQKDLPAGKAGFPQIIIRFYPSEKVAGWGFNIGEVQVLMGLSNPFPQEENPQIVLKQKIDFSKIVTVLYYIKDPLLSSRSMRQALSYSAPQIEGEELANNPFPKTSWAFDPDAKKYLSNPKEATAALERAKGVLSSEKLNQQLILTTTSNLEDVARLVVEAWEELGFDVKLRVESGIPQNFQALLITQSIPEDPDQYFLWHSTQEKTNLTKYLSARVDKDLEDGRKALTQEERKQKYFD
ncbi:MAG: ABC transporter substrate-binding protein, partial [Candidatus Daviesbacteria bacterium]|nr:ABC transporter substrate-binding protein [Candidatus Daviesbacteria bacterium]